MSTKAGLGTIIDPTPLDFRRAVFTQVHYARDMLSLAEIQGGSDDPQTEVAIAYINAAIAALRSSCTLLRETDTDNGVRMNALIERANHAAQAALGHVYRYQAYRRYGVHSSKLERDTASKLRPIWKRSAEEAKKDVHRALMFICERWPDSHERKEVS